MPSQKNFDEWNSEKKSFELRDVSTLFFREGEVWMASCGVNLGYEQDGKGVNKVRPLIIVKKFNSDLFWGIPLSTTVKQGKYYFSYEFTKGTVGKAILSQVRLFDKKRLLKKLDDIPFHVLRKIKKKLIQLLLE